MNQAEPNLESTNISQSEFRRAAYRGLGRAVVYLKKNRWEPHSETLEHLCLHNTAYDPQCEGSRAQYTYDLVCLTGNKSRFVEIVTRGLSEATEHWDVYQLFDLASLFATHGHPELGAAMRQRFSRNTAPEREIGAMALIRIGGIDGLLFIARQVGKRLVADADYVVDESLMDQATEVLGNEATDALSHAASDDWRSIETKTLPKPL